jgi:hypothetical protein
LLVACPIVLFIVGTSYVFYWRSLFLFAGTEKIQYGPSTLPPTTAPPFGLISPTLNVISNMTMAPVITGNFTVAPGSPTAPGGAATTIAASTTPAQYYAAYDEPLEAKLLAGAVGSGFLVVHFVVAPLCSNILAAPHTWHSLRTHLALASFFFSVFFAAPAAVLEYLLLSEPKYYPRPYTTDVELRLAANFSCSICAVSAVLALWYAYILFAVDFVQQSVQGRALEIMRENRMRLADLRRPGVQVPPAVRMAQGTQRDDYDDVPRAGQRGRSAAATGEGWDNNNNWEYEMTPTVAATPTPSRRLLPSA